MFSIHGGPEGQTKPGFQGRNNYLINELGIAIFYPNVRGSTGYGKRFVALDNGPFKREDSVKDIGAFLDRLAGRPPASTRAGSRRQAAAMAATCATPARSATPGASGAGAVHSRDLQLRDVPRKYPELSPRPAPRRIRRRAACPSSAPS